MRPGTGTGHLPHLALVTSQTRGRRGDLSCMLDLSTHTALRYNTSAGHLHIVKATPVYDNDAIA